MIPLSRDMPVSVCFCGMPYVPSDPDVMHIVHYQCLFCRTEHSAEMNIKEGK